MKRISFYSMLIIIAVLFSSCAPKPIDKTDVSQTANGFIDAIKDYNFENIGSYLSETPNSTTQGLLIDIYTDENYVALYKKTAKKSKYVVSSIVENEQSATVTVTANCYDLKSGYSTALLSIAAMVMEDEKLMQEMLDENTNVTHYIPQTIQKLIDDGSIAKEEKSIELTLIKDESNNYTVKLDDNAKSLITSGISDAIAGITGNLNQ